MQLVNALVRHNTKVQHASFFIPQLQIIGGQLAPLSRCFQALQSSYHYHHFTICVLQAVLCPVVENGS